MVEYTKLRYLAQVEAKLYTNFEICERKFHKNMESTLIYKVKQFMLKDPSNIYILYIYGASSV